MYENQIITNFLSAFPMNSKIALFSTSELSLCLCKYIKKYRNDLSVLYFVDSNKQGLVEQTPIVSPQELKNNIKTLDFVILASFASSKKLEEICNELNISNYVKIDKEIYHALNNTIVEDIKLLREEMNDKLIQERKEFVPAGHYYSVIPSDYDVEQGILKNRSDEIKIAGVNLNLEKQLENLEFFKEASKKLNIPLNKQDDKLYYGQNDWFLLNAGFVLASMILKNKPKQIIEIGSGFSTSIMCDVNKEFFDLSIDITSIEPEPDRLMQVMGERFKEITLYPKRIQDVDLEIFSKLEENDLLFIDSTHVAKINSDVLRNFYEILPRLNRGVLVHFHDIPNNFEYYENWLEEGRYWNEAYLLRAFLQYNDTFEIEFFNDYMSNYILKNNIDFPCSVGGGSIYLRKTK